MPLIPTRTSRRSHQRKLPSGKTVKVRRTHTTVHRRDDNGNSSWAWIAISTMGRAVLNTGYRARDGMKLATRKERARRRSQYRELNRQMKTLADHPHLLRSVLDTIEHEPDWERANLAVIEAGRALRDDRHRGRSRRRQLGRALWRTAAWTVWAGRRAAWEFDQAEETLTRLWNAEADELFSLTHPRSPWSKSGLPAPPRMPGQNQRDQRDPVKGRLLVRLQHALCMDAVGIASQGLVPEKTTRTLRRPLTRIMAAVIEVQEQSTSVEKLSETELRAMAADAAYHLQEARDWAAGPGMTTSGHLGTDLDELDVGSSDPQHEQELTIIRETTPST